MLHPLELFLALQTEEIHGLRNDGELSRTAMIHGGIVI